MPKRLRPTASFAADAVLVGDPGRALLLAQELVEQPPKMSNHARGLWGYWGTTAEGRELTIQSTGMGGPSAAAVLADLAKLGVRRAVRVGTCVAGADGPQAGALLVVERAVAEGGSAAAFGLAVGETVEPDPVLTEGLRRELGDGAAGATVASFDSVPAPGDRIPDGALAADMQTVAVLARAASLGIAAAAVLIVVEDGAGRPIGDEPRETLAKAAGNAAGTVLST
jgi:uridine phosphorylase